MTFAAALYSYMASDYGIRAIVGDDENAQPRIYPVISPPQPKEEDAPYGDHIVYSLGSRQDQNRDLSGRGHVDATWVIACLSHDYDRSHELMDAAIAALNFFQGPMPSAGGVEVHSCELQDARDDYDFDLGLHAAVLVFAVSYTP